MRARRRASDTRVLLSVAAALIGAAAAAPAPAAAADPCAAPVTSVIACENSKPGTPPDDWQTAGAGDPTIQGYATSMSVPQGATVTFKIKTPASSYHIDILRLGYYGGDGARKVAAGLRPSATLPQSQPACLQQASTGLVDCGNWAASASWTVPADAVSGVYIAHLIRDDTGGDSQILFVVRDDARHSDILVQTSDATWQAYNAYGGNSLYKCTVACPAGNPKAYKAAYAVSYNRPFDGAVNDQGRSYLYYAEYQMIRFLERNGYDVSYTSEADVDAGSAPLKNHRLFIASGHDEYWSADMRANVQSARDAGVNLAFFTGNDIFWKTRFGPSIDSSATARRTLITYKDTHFDTPVDPVTWTGTWRDPRFAASPAGANPENALTGQYFVVNSGTADITVPSQFSGLRFWRNTAVAGLGAGQTRTLSPNTGTLGYEWDVDVDNGARPAGLFHLSSTTVGGLEAFADFGSTTTSGASATHTLTLYRASSGALVFGAGTVQWAWGLDTTNAWGSAGPPADPPDPVMEQATVNLFADMGSRPATLQTGLVAATASTDTTAPTSTISSPAAGATLADGRRMTVTGTATDSGGVVAGVEVSTDDGATWHPATGTSSWSYSWVADRSPATTIRSRAVDDSGNRETPTAGVHVSVPCPCSLFGDTTPAAVDSQDTGSVEVGVKFKPEVDGSVTGVRFYKAAANAGTHVGNLWSASGALLARATFTGESGSGWQSVTFSSPVAVTAGTTYVASYFAPAGHYSTDAGYFFTPGPLGGSKLDSPPLQAVGGDGNGPDGGNGLFGYGSASTFPTTSWQGGNYWVDVLFTPAAPPGPVSGVAATAGAGSATVTWSAPATGGAPTRYVVTPYIGTAAQTTTLVTGTPPQTRATPSSLTPGQPYTFTVRPENGTGAGPESPPTAAVTPTAVTTPGAPTGVTVTPSAGAVQVDWTAPGQDGGSAITDYTVTPYVGTLAQAPVDVGGTGVSKKVTGLTNGTTYAFTVTAVNALGAGPASVRSAPATPQIANSIFDATAVPTVVDSGDGNAVELGVAFRSDIAGIITGIRFYKAAANTGTHSGSLWTTGGLRLATATFANESASGWQQVNFSTPVSVSADRTYVASYFAPRGHYSYSSGFFATATDNPPLHAPANATIPNGVYAYSAASAFPAGSFNATSYSVDVVFAPPPAVSPPGLVENVTATAGQESAAVSWSAPAAGSPPTAYKVTPWVGSTAQAAKTVNAPATGTTVPGLTAGQSYTFTVQPTGDAGDGPVSAQSNAVTPTSAPKLTVPAAPTGVTALADEGAARVSWTAPADGGSPLTSYTVTPFAGNTAQAPQTVAAPATGMKVTGLTDGTSYTFVVKATNALGDSAASAPSGAVTPRATIFDFGVPPTVDAGDPNGVELGVKFTSDVAGSVLGVRFYKADTNTGTHVGSLWTIGGTLLERATFSAETPSGWQQVTFPTPVRITPGTTYVASYFAPNGHYSHSASGLAGPIDNPPLHTVSNAISPNGVYAYGGASAFPVNTWNAANYWVDVAFVAGP